MGKNDEDGALDEEDVRLDTRMFGWFWEADGRGGRSTAGPRNLHGFSSQ